MIIGVQLKLVELALQILGTEKKYYKVNAMNSRAP